jgi:putative FmdB family regulatory protein
MPTYQYRCTECDAELEVVQKFSDDALTVCPECDGRLRKVYNAVGVVFKGSGFYATDNRPKKHGTGKPKTESAESSTKSEKKAPAASSSTEKTPAA